MNNCGCDENQFEGEMIATIMKGSVKAVADMGWDGLKLDSCSQFNNLSWWNQLINETGKPVLLENCHQGGYVWACGQGCGRSKDGRGGLHSARSIRCKCGGNMLNTDDVERPSEPRN